MSAVAALCAAFLVCAVPLGNVTSATRPFVRVAETGVVTITKHIVIGHNTDNNYLDDVTRSEICSSLGGHRKHVFYVHTNCGGWPQCLIGGHYVRHFRRFYFINTFVYEQHIAMAANIYCGRLAVVGEFNVCTRTLFWSVLSKSANLGRDISSKFSFGRPPSVLNRSFSRQPEQYGADEKESRKSGDGVSEGSMEPMSGGRDERPKIALAQFAFGVVFFVLAAALNTYDGRRWRLVAAHVFGVLGVCAFGLGLIVLG